MVQNHNHYTTAKAIYSVAQEREIGREGEGGKGGRGGEGRGGEGRGGRGGEGRGGEGEGRGGEGRGYALLMTDNKPETVLYRAPTFSLLADVTWWA